MSNVIDCDTLDDMFFEQLPAVHQDTGDIVSLDNKHHLNDDQVALLLADISPAVDTEDSTIPSQFKI